MNGSTLNTSTFTAVGTKEAFAASVLYSEKQNKAVTAL
jgi:hypothetical protein